MGRQPRWELADALRRARTAQRLANKHSALVTPRLSSGLSDRLLADRSTLGDASARGGLALTQQKSSTGGERGSAQQGHALVMLVRDSVARTRGAGQDLKQAIGIGDGLKPTDTQGIVAALRAIVGQALALGASGVLADDIALATHLAADLLAADGRQAESMDARADTTESRIDTQLRLEEAIDEISSRGALAHRSDNVVRERFQRLVAGSGPTTEDEAQAGEEPPPVTPGA